MLFVFLYILLYLPIKLFYPTKIIGKKNLPKDKGYILTCNHFSNLDPILLDIYLCKKIRYLAKKELFKKKFSAHCLKKLGAFPVDRQNADMSAYKFAIKTLKDKHTLGIFPEGTRNINEGEMLELKNGAIVFASKGDAVIVPMMLYRKPKFMRRNYLVIGEPFDIVAVDKRRLTQEEKDINTNMLAERIQKLRNDLDMMLAKKRKKQK